MGKTNKPKFCSIEECISRAGASKGTWDGPIGNSVFHPECKKAVKILTNLGINGISYRRGIPDFTYCSEITIKIKDMTDNRMSNFRQADSICALTWNNQKKFGRTDWTARAVKEWRKANKYSWHECIDLKTMRLIQRDIHLACGHIGGVAEYKRKIIANQDN